MGGEMLGNKIQLSNGSFNLKGDLSDNVTSLSGELKGKATASVSYSLTAERFYTKFSGDISLDMNSNIEVTFNEGGMTGSFDATVNGNGRVSIENDAISTSAQASVTCIGSVSYNGTTLVLTGDLTVTLPFKIPVWYPNDSWYDPTITNKISTGTISISF
jgi:hypothetical protein